MVLYKPHTLCEPFMPLWDYEKQRANLVLADEAQLQEENLSYLSHKSVKVNELF